MTTAVEELLRYTAPVFMTTERYAREDVTRRGVTIPRGEMTLGVIGSANRDETVFEHADTLDITREPNRPLSFGQGIHFCLGAPPARMEAQIAFGTLLRRMPHLRLKVSPDACVVGITKMIPSHYFGGFPPAAIHAAGLGAVRKIRRGRVS